MVYAFDNCELDTQRITLRRAGQTIPLRPKVFQVLIHLLTHRERVVDKQELAEQVWPEQFISDATLESTLRAVRRAIGDSGKEQRIIQTLYGHGYRFVAPVTAQPTTREADEEQARPGSSGPAEPLQGDPVEVAHVPAAAAPVVAPSPRPVGETWSCPVCQHVNHADQAAGSWFCSRCGTPLRPHCPRCGVEHRPQAQFCAACGAALSAPPRPASPPQTDQTSVVQADQTPPGDTPAVVSGAPEAERRQLTVMFCDLADSTALAEHLGPEDFYDMIRAYQDACAGIIQRFDGHIAQYLGDGLLVYFGYPLAHEDDARRAVQAGLGIIDALGPLKTRLAQEKGVSLAMRVGIHTGLVVVGAIGTGARQEHLALGETPNIAARIQGLAAPDTLVISEATAHLVHGFFTYQSLEAQTLRGIAQPLTLYRVLGATGAQSRLDVVDPRGLTPLVGRQAEIALLLERWGQVREGFGHVVVLSGEAGIGKSRLAQILKAHPAEASLTRLECRCSPYHQQSAWHPTVELFSQILQWQQDDTPDTKLHKLEMVLTQCALPLDEAVPLLAALLALPGTDARYPPRPLTPQQWRHKTLQAILAVVLGLAAQHPVLLTVEDLHWVDPSTLEVLTLLVEQTPSVPLCLVVTCRPTFQVPWGVRSYLTQITLQRLPRAQVEQIVTSLTGGKALPPEVLRRLVDGTDGVPLFVEELTKAVLETGVLRDATDHYEVTAPLRTLAIPTTLHDSLMARLDRLGSAKSVAQLGAVLGRRFPYAWLHAVAQQDDVSLQRALGPLVEAELLYQQGFPPQATYVFKHALIQEVAYQSLVRPTRQHYHQRIAQVLAEQFPETTETQPELLAHHYTEAGLAAPAVPYWLRAGERATERSANVEAVSHLTKGLELLKTLPETPERAQQELALQLALGSPLLMIKGQAAPEVEQVYSRALELCKQVGDNAQRFAALVGLRRFYISAGQLQTTRELSEQSLALAQRLDDPALLWEAHLTLGGTLFYLGELEAALLHLQQGLALYAPEQSRFQVFSSGADPQPLGLSHAAFTLWLLGHPERALTSIHEALALARQSPHPYTLARALHGAATVHQFRCEAPLVQQSAEAVIALSHEHGFARWLGRGLVMRGWALVAQGTAEEGIEQLREGLAVLQSVADELGRPVFLGSLAEAYGKVGQPEAGLLELEKALALAYKTQELRWEAELYRLKGELLRGTSHPIEAEACFQQALEVARRQQAKSLELRGAMSLSRLWQSQGKRAEARQLLAQIYAWFTEGFETVDIQEAKALLAALQ